MGTGLKWALLTLSALLTVIGTSTGETGGDDVKCEALGFTGLALCSDCDSLAEYVKDQELESDCRKCCAQESDDSISKTTYAGAILEVCSRKLAYYPNIQSVIDKLFEFHGVEVEYRYGLPPKLIMLDGHGNFKETIRIDNWKSEHIEKFLKEKVRPSALLSKDEETLPQSGSV
ncbi:unnamed protein product [Calypogeia fissa]